MAEATTYWSKICTGQDPPPCGYIDAGLTECQPDGMCVELVLCVVEQKGGDETDRMRSIQTALVSSMCWLRTVSTSGFDGFSGRMSSYRYKALVECLFHDTYASQKACLAHAVAHACAASGGKREYPCTQALIMQLSHSPSYQVCSLCSCAAAFHLASCRDTRWTQLILCQQTSSIHHCKLPSYPPDLGWPLCMAGSMLHIAYLPHADSMTGSNAALKHFLGSL